MIKVLPDRVANMIAAGEVVSRPASVVKELMENAVDAGADEVKVIVCDAGRTLVRVIDNGCAMSGEEAVLCFERHATSKISDAEDLGRIITFGFRGEALPSIASVSQVTLTTRREEDETAFELSLEEYGSSRTKRVSAPKGTSIAVRNLFYNTPARRKFLKSDQVELRHIIEEFTHVALTRPEIAFSLSSNGSDIFVLKKAKSLKFRIMDLLGSSVARDIADFSADTTLLKIRGFAGRPDTAKKTQGNQFFFVNGRFFRSPYLHKAVLNAYGDMMPQGLNPVYFIYLELDPSSIDVNVSPTKTEVKFENENVIFQAVYASVREALGRSSFAATLDFNTEGSVQMPRVGEGFEQFRGGTIEPSADFDPSYNPFDTLPSSSSSGSLRGYGEDSFRLSQKPRDYSALFSADQAEMPSEQLFCIGGKYIVTKGNDSLMVVNVRRAWQRILYERSLEALKGSAGQGATASQTTLFPVEVNVGVQGRLLIEDKAVVLQSLGFEIAPFSRDSVVVSAVPEGCSSDRDDVAALVEDILDFLSAERTDFEQMMQISLCERLSSAGSSRCQSVSTPAQARLLLDTLFACANSDYTPAGKRICLILGAEEIDKRFQE